MRPHVCTRWVYAALSTKNEHIFKNRPPFASSFCVGIVSSFVGRVYHATTAGEYCKYKRKRHTKRINKSLARATPSCHRHRHLGSRRLTKAFIHNHLHGRPEIEPHDFLRPFLPQPDRAIVSIADRALGQVRYVFRQSVVVRQRQPDSLNNPQTRLEKEVGTKMSEGQRKRAGQRATIQYHTGGSDRLEEQHEPGKQVCIGY